jgi:hypothetical protein
VHDYARRRCSQACALARLKLRWLEADYRQYWYDRKRGVPPMTMQRWLVLYRRFP